MENDSQDSLSSESNESSMSLNGNASFPPLQMTAQQIRKIIIGSEIGKDSLQKKQSTNSVPETGPTTTLSDESKPQKSSGNTALPTPDATADWRICVFNENNRGVRYTVKDIPLLETMKTYCDKFGLSIKKLRFKYDGISIGVTDTLTTLELDEDDIIEVVISHNGD